MGEPSFYMKVSLLMRKWEHLVSLSTPAPELCPPMPLPPPQSTIPDLSESCGVSLGGTCLRDKVKPYQRHLSCK